MQNLYSIKLFINIIFFEFIMHISIINYMLLIYILNSISILYNHHIFYKNKYYLIIFVYYLLYLTYNYLTYNKKPVDKSTGSSWVLTWQLPTLPHSLPCSTIGVIELNFPVRNGKECFLYAIITRYSEIYCSLKIAHQILLIFLLVKPSIY